MIQISKIKTISPNYFILFSKCTLFCFMNISQMINAKVIKIVDGDTIYLGHKKYGKIKVRLAEIDTPERDQPHGKIATDVLKKMILKKSVELHKVTIDKYKRVVGTIYLNNLEINYFLVRNGFAWCYDKYYYRKKKKAEKPSKIRKDWPMVK